METEFIFYSGQGTNCYYMTRFTEPDIPKEDLTDMMNCQCEGALGWGIFTSEGEVEAITGDWVLRIRGKLMVVEGYRYE